MMTDPLGDMLIRIKNGYLARLKTVEIPYSKVKENLGNVLAKSGFIKDIKIENTGVKKSLTVTLSYNKEGAKLLGVERVSKPGVRVYTSKKDIPTILSGMGEVVLSTPLGIMTGKEAKKKGIGGEIICKVW
ncbi:30S ribosomal protein S8 [Candidatus Gottesmanbacteria bacterium]|nr:30S ribosomal protein S8 [Candidatus Gottesmanbacteria bacterium]